MIPYREVAKKALYEWNYKYSMEDQEEAKKRAEMEAKNLSIEELESNVYAKDSMNYAIDGIAEYLKAQEIELTDEEVEEYRKAVLEGPEDAEIMKTIQEKMKEVKNTNELEISTLANIHNGWVKDNAKKFFARERKHQHMPLEIIGWKEVTSDLIFLKPILEAANVEVDEKELEETYNETVKKYLKERNIETTEDLENAIVKGADFYPALEGQEEIIEAIKSPEYVREVVIPQIEKNGMGKVEDVVEKVTPKDIEEVTEMVTTEGMMKQANEMEKAINPEKEEQQQEVDE